ncbi:hypothetical protein [Leptospira biflexa]|uniref:hypothetical protein n=1 Tax=Leptospira biflexa TaxID=172 RepID=UPI0010845D7D|nr:hypothetical protein [Leptospira biflexa]TGM33719.1 hypothetical protein EHQ80_15860 [Leptospira biflexa]TGM35415.1 hypothetical protein EHQ89_10865 [Leptospira biflexa]TGM57309.1 hypothetical protein EHQ91_00175 [Leptospira biflexa]
MLEIRHYVKLVLNTPFHQVDLGSLSLDALWFDVLFSRTKEGKFFPFSKSFDSITNLNLKAIHVILANLFFDKESQIPEFPKETLLNYLTNTLPILSDLVPKFDSWTTDSERAEELVRNVFQTLNLLPQGETKEYFNDRFRSIDSRERTRILEETKKAQERAKEILRQMKQKEEEEAASKYNRE